jgi:ADP-dependent phosphofructokinase/glucokinase
MGRKKKDIVEEIENRVQETIDLLALKQTIQCDPTRSDYVKCILRRAMVHIELRKRRDKIVRQLAFGFVTSRQIEEKEVIEEIVNGMIQIGLINEEEWMKAINDALRYVNRIDGIDTRERIKRIGEEVSRMLEEGMK